MSKNELSPGRGSELLATIKRSTGANARPLLLTGGSVISMDKMMGDWEQADVLIVGDVIVGVGPGLLTAADDDNAIVIDCKGMVVLPSKLDFTSLSTTGSLTPGNPADIAVITPRNHLDILIKEGKLLVWDGASLEGLGEQVKAEPFPALPKDHPHVGMWIDENNFLRQELLPNGRYDEARGDRPSAYQGQYWIMGSKILYLDDLGFWAFGEFRDNTLYHAGYRLSRHNAGRHHRSNGEIIRGLYEAVNKKDLDYIRNLGASFSEWLDVPFNYTTYGETSIIDPWVSWFGIFPDATCEVKSLVELGDHVIAQGIGRGTHKGEFNSPAGLLKPSGVAMQVNFCDVYRLRDGKIERADSYFDFYSLLMQLRPNAQNNQ